MPDEIKAIPEGYNSLNAYFVVPSAADAIEFYTKALGATELFRMEGPGGSVMHAEVRIGDSWVSCAR